MKKLLLIFITLTMSVMVISQENTKQKEVGLVFYNLDSFGLTYKVGTENSLWRFNTLLISGNDTDESSDSLDTKQSNIGFGIKIGKEYRKIIVQNLEFRYGADLAFTYSYYKFNYDDKTVNNNDITSKRTTYRPGINLVLGLNYVLKDHFVIGAELLPHITYQTGTSKGSDYRNDNETEKTISGLSYGLNSTSALLSLSYRF